MERVSGWDVFLVQLTVHMLRHFFYSHRAVDMKPRKIRFTVLALAGLLLVGCALAPIAPPGYGRAESTTT